MHVRLAKICLLLRALKVNAGIMGVAKAGDMGVRTPPIGLNVLVIYTINLLK